MLLFCRSSANDISRHNASHNPLGTRRHIVEGPSHDSAASHMRQLGFFICTDVMPSNVRGLQASLYTRTNLLCGATVSLEAG